jgi:hypothetical protein
VFEAVTMLIRALATGVVAIQARPTRTTNHIELGSAPRTGPVSGARVRDDRHGTVLRPGCDRAPTVSPLLRLAAVPGSADRPPAVARCEPDAADRRPAARRMPPACPGAQVPSPSDSLVNRQ